MKAPLICLIPGAFAFPGLAAAHTGHIAEVAGHDHWVAGAAIGAAIAISLWAALKGGRKAESEPEAAEDEAADATPQES
ncbi:hypothetical protein PSA7680_01415 [Pseudoruegeria aquimaris]|uniref:Uncharacterized protein n=1 Tax=Pseudoruegeria aquimaris TaxID=393663 RepID=A0A1Y5S531_9RHOB|nr:DUF6732 family protein [Pseudoruegeria aquimaris]SLN29987.1 hypothetical protein PSA7680_01415 [Pseudoruegeria aquimaris]